MSAAVKPRAHEPGLRHVGCPLSADMKADHNGMDAPTRNGIDVPARHEVARMIVRRSHPTGPAVPSAVPYEVGRRGNEPSRSLRTMYLIPQGGVGAARQRPDCKHRCG